MKKVLHGQGATPERLGKSQMETGIREISKGGMALSVGHRDLEHCALDFLINGGYIEQDQFDAGMHLRNLYYTHTTTGRWIDEGGRGHESEELSSADIAYEVYSKALKAVTPAHRGITMHVCIEAVQIPTYYAVIHEVQHGLDDLINYFQKKMQKDLQEILKCG